MSLTVVLHAAHHGVGKQAVLPAYRGRGIFMARFNHFSIAPSLFAFDACGSGVSGPVGTYNAGFQSKPINSLWAYSVAFVTRTVYTPGHLNASSFGSAGPIRVLDHINDRGRRV